MIRRSATANSAASPNVTPLTFGQRMGINNPPETEKVDAQIWLNVGYLTGNQEYPFVSLPFGIPIDTQQPLELRGRNADFNTFVTHRNKLLEQIKQAGDALAPGEEAYLSMIGDNEEIGPGLGLVIQLRRRESKDAAKPTNEGFLPEFELKLAV